MPLLRAFFGFVLPGFAAGWILSGGILRFSGDAVWAGALFATAAWAGALTGRWLIRNRALLGPGVLLLPAAAALPQLFILIFPLTAFAFGILAVRPLRPQDRRNFQYGVLLAMLGALLFGGTALLAPVILRGVLLTLLPAALMLTADALPEYRRSAVLLTAAAGIVLAVLPGWQTFFPERYSAAGAITRYLPEKTDLLLLTGSGQYRFPRDLFRHSPDLLTAALQPQAEVIRVLVVEDVPSRAAERLHQFPWVGKADILQLSGLPGDTSAAFHNVPALMKYLLAAPQSSYDLVLFLEMTGNNPAARKLLLETTAEKCLSPQGVLVFPGRETPNLPDWQLADLPGSRQYFKMASRRGCPLADTFEKLEKRLQDRSANQGEFLPAGLLQDLYELRPPEPVTEQAVPPSGTRFLHGIRIKPLPFLPFNLILIGLLLAVIFWLSRYPVCGENFAVFTRAAGIMLTLTVLLTAASRFQPLLARPLPVLFGLLALAIPHRRETARWPGRMAVLLTAAAGCCLLFLPHPPPGMILPVLLLTIPLFWFSTGSCGTDSAKHLHFYGLPFGLCLAVLLPPETALPVAMLLLWL